jgi:hypothetical protein
MPEPYWEVMSYSEAKSMSTVQAAALVTNVGAAVSGILSEVLIGFAGKTLDSFPPAVRSYLTKLEGLAGVLKQTSIGDIYLPIENELIEDYGNIIAALKAGIGQGVGGVHAGLYEAVAGTGTLLLSYNGIRERIGIDPYITRYTNDAFRPNIPDAETSWFMNRIGQLSNESFKSLVNQNGWDNDWLTSLNAVWTRQPSLDILFSMRRRGYIDNDAFQAILKWYRFTDESIVNVTKLAEQFPEPYRLADMSVKNHIDDETYKNAMTMWGLSPDWAMKWREAQRTILAPAELLALVRRRIITPTDYDNYMRWSGYSIEEANQYFALVNVIPPINDLIHFAVREAYGDHTSEVQYDNMVTMASKMGLSDEAAAWYWYAHWERIPVNFMFANYHRGYWDKTKLEHMLKIIDMHPDDRTDIMNVAYSPPNVRELGYGYDVGIYSLEDIIKFRRWGGLSPEDAEKAGIANVQYRTETERNAIRTANLQLYKLGKISKEEYEVAIRTVTPQDLAVQLWLERGELEYEIAKKPAMDTEGRIVSSSEALTAFKLKLRDEDWTRASLKELDWTQDRIDVAIEHAKLDVTTTEQKESEVKYRKLTLAQITNSYKLHLMSKEIMTTEIVLIGYSPDDAELLTEIYTAPTAPTTVIKNYTVADAARLYHYQMFDEDDIYNNYLEDGYDEAHASMLTLMTRLNLDTRTVSSESVIKRQSQTYQLS